jgi:hypothetical protein
MDKKATVQYKAGERNYTFPFPYLSKQFVKARYEKKGGTQELTYTQDYNIEGQQLQLRTAGIPEDTLCIYRQTPTGSLVDFNDGSILLASEMDKMTMQMLHIEEENSDYLLINGMLADKATNAWQGQGRRIAHLEDPTDPQDAVTLHHLETVGGMASKKELEDIREQTRDIKNETNDIKNLAAQHRQDAIQAYQLTEASKEAVKTMENNVLALRNEVGQQSTHIEQMQEDVQKVEQRVNQKEAAAGRSKEQAEQAATAAINAKDRAIQAETNANEASHSASVYLSQMEDKVQNAADSAEAAYNEAKNAETRATEAAQSATNAQQSATAAAGSAAGAENSAQSAQQSAAEAQSHAHFDGVIKTNHIENGAVTEEKLNAALWNKLDKTIKDANSLRNNYITSSMSLIDRSKTGAGILYGKDIPLQANLNNYTFLCILYAVTFKGSPLVHIKTYNGRVLISCLANVEHFNLTGDSNAVYVIKGSKNNSSFSLNNLHFLNFYGTYPCGIADIIGFNY